MKNQAGLSFFGVVAVVAGIVFTAMLAMKIGPVYLTDMKVKSALETTAEDASSTKMSRQDFLNRLSTKLQVDYALDAINLREDVVFERVETGTMVTVSYEKIVPIVHNLSALMEFESSVEIPGK